MSDLRRRRGGHLFTAALELIQRQGFEGTTVNQIAEYAGVSRRTFFNYFPTKESLLVHLHGEVTRQVIAVLRDSDEFPPLGRVRRALLHFGTLFKDHHALAGRLLSQEMSAPALRRQDEIDSAALLPLLYAELRAARDRGDVRGDVQPVHASKFLLSVVIGAVTHWAHDPRGRPDDLTHSMTRRLDWAILGLTASPPRGTTCPTPSPASP